MLITCESPFRLFGSRVEGLEDKLNKTISRSAKAKGRWKKGRKRINKNTEGKGLNSTIIGTSNSFLHRNCDEDRNKAIATVHVGEVVSIEFKATNEDVVDMLMELEGEENP
ncbi:hypothetical protein V6N13_114125 [Hibiscus sabdariffa]